MGETRNQFSQKVGVCGYPGPLWFSPVYEFDWGDALPSWRAFVWNEDVLHEVVGLIWYWVRGRI
jgi:hypothetical protein